MCGTFPISCFKFCIVPVFLRFFFQLKTNCQFAPLEGLVTKRQPLYCSPEGLGRQSPHPKWGRGYPRRSGVGCDRRFAMACCTAACTGSPLPLWASTAGQSCPGSCTWANGRTSCLREACGSRKRGIINPEWLLQWMLHTIQHLRNQLFNE